MSYIPTIEQAEDLLKKYNKEPFHIRHAQIVSGVMGYFASLYDKGNEEYWRVVGMLHDIDFEQFPQQHCVKGREILQNEGVNEGIIRSAMSHGYGIGGIPEDIRPESKMEKLLFAADELTGLIGATAIMRPSKSVNDLELPSVKKKFKDKKFAAGCSRDVIKQGADMLGITLDELIETTILAMRSLTGIMEI